MKKLFKSFYTALIIYIIIISLSFLVALSVNNVDDEDFRRVYITSFFVFFPPLFFSLNFFKLKEDWKFYFKAPIFSFLLVYCVLYFYFNYSKFRVNLSFFEVSLFMNATMSFFTALFLNFILYIKAKKNTNLNILANTVNYSFKILLLIPFSIAIIYSFLIFIGTSSFFNVAVVFFNLLPMGIILSFSCFYFFSKLNNKKSALKSILFYFSTTLICALLSSFSVMFLKINKLELDEILLNIIGGITLFSPFFLFVTALVHLYFLHLVNKQEKTSLTQQSLVSQLNYQQLKNQLSPHFLFNNINVLTSLIEENPKKAVQFSENLSHIYRYFLEQEKQDVVLVKDEINFAKSYLELLNNRFEIGLSFLIEIDEKAEEKYIVSKVLQQVLENVVKHNTINNENFVAIKIISNEKYLIVENNKTPKISAFENSKKGIENIKKRIAFFTDEKVIIENTTEMYTIQLPILETL